MSSFFQNETGKILEELTPEEVEKISGGHEDCQVSGQIVDGKLIVTGIDGDGC